MTTQTLQKILANKLKNLATIMTHCAYELRQHGTREAKQHANELKGAAKTVRQWSKEVMKS